MQFSIISLFLVALRLQVFLSGGGFLTDFVAWEKSGHLMGRDFLGLYKSLSYICILPK
jgi:hypothetical protein